MLWIKIICEWLELAVVFSVFEIQLHLRILHMNMVDRSLGILVMTDPDSVDNRDLQTILTNKAGTDKKKIFEPELMYACI